jgi:L-alanine-DL-glutamate epimerase-like enolase superfamily enzyme
MTRRRLEIAAEGWPIEGHFTIARGSKAEARVVVASLHQEGHSGHGEGVPYPRYGETVEAAVADLEAARPAIEAGATRSDVPGLVKSMAARNALDCALWDLEAKMTATPVWRLAGLPQPRPLVTAFTIGLDEPTAMAAAAAKAASRPLLKVKLGRDGDEDRLRLVRAAVPQARLIVDANEGWTVDTIEKMLACCAEAGVEMVEQPLPAAADEILRHLPRHTRVCADESAHGVADLPSLVGKYDAINIKLDKTGGLTGALALATAAAGLGFSAMTGCMVSTSLAMAPAFLVAQLTAIADLDGPLLLRKDRAFAISYAGSLMSPPDPRLWG